MWFCIPCTSHREWRNRQKLVIFNTWTWDQNKAHLYEGIIVFLIRWVFYTFGSSAPAGASAPKSSTCITITEDRASTRLSVLSCQQSARWFRILRLTECRKYFVFLCVFSSFHQSAVSQPRFTLPIIWSYIIWSHMFTSSSSCQGLDSQWAGLA